MLFRITSFFRWLCRSQQTGLGHYALPFHELTRELEDLRKFSLNLLMVFLGIHLIAGSKVLGALTLALLIYTISLHLTISASFLRNCPSLSKFLHAVPILGISCMAAVELVINVQSPALAACGILLGTLPSLIIAIYHARGGTGMALTYLPIRIREVTHPGSDVTDALAVLN